METLTPATQAFYFTSPETKKTVSYHMKPIDEDTARTMPIFEKELGDDVRFYRLWSVAIQDGIDSGAMFAGPLVKVNHTRKVVYFLSRKVEATFLDIPVFESKGQKVKFYNL